MRVITHKSEDAIKTLKLMSNLTHKNIIDYLKENGPTSPTKLSRELNISTSTASRCLKKLREYNILKARWKTESVDERPIKLYSLVPNVLRFEYVLHQPRPGESGKVRFKGQSLSEFEENDRKGIYVSLEKLPFRFEGLTADMLKEIEKNDYSLEELKEKYSEEEGFRNSFQKLLTLGLVEIEQKEED